MEMSDVIRCCPKKPKYKATYSVAGDLKSYLVCESCIELDCFQQFLISKKELEFLEGS